MPVLGIFLIKERKAGALLIKELKNKKLKERTFKRKILETKVSETLGKNILLLENFQKEMTK